MKRTIFNTPILTPILRLIGNSLMRLTGWRVDGRLPDIPKFLLVGAPHTSNWDFVLFLGIVFHLKEDIRYMGKAELFRSPIGWFFYYCGGVPVDRSKSTGLVEQMVEACNKADTFKLTITPEGTRKYVREWKRGFYHIAKGAGIPLVFGKVDGKRKTVCLGEVFYLTDDINSDMQAIQERFKGFVGINPRKKYITLED